MSKKSKKSKNLRSAAPTIGWIPLSDADSIICSGYTSLDHSPEIMTGCRRIAELIGSLTIHLMANTDRGDERIINELSAKIDINPNPYQTRKAFIESVVMNLLLYGNGNSIVLPHTHKGLLGSLEPISAERVSFNPQTYTDYQIMIDGRPFNPDEVLHFTLNPDRTYMWKGRGLRISLKDVANNLKQAAATEKAFMQSKWKPSIIVKVDAMTEEFSSADGRERLRKEYIDTNEAGEPWIIPAEQFQIEQVRPLSLSDIAINDNVQMDKRTVAAILGVPPFLLGVGEYNKNAWNAFISTTIRPIVIGLQQELTKKLILSPKWYLKFNVLSLYDWDLQTLADVFGKLSDRGFVTGNEVRDRLGMTPLDGLDELRVLENYIGWEYSNLQKKLIQEDDKNG